MIQGKQIQSLLRRGLRGARLFLRAAVAFSRSFRKRYPSVSRVLGFSMSALLAVSILCTVFSAAGLTYALEVTVNGTSYGYVESRQVADTALSDLCASVETGADCAEVSLDTQLTYAVVSRDSLLSSEELISTIVGGEDKYRQTIGVFANGRLVSYCSNRDVALNKLAQLADDGTYYFGFDVRNCVVDADAFAELTPLSRLEECTLPVELSVTCEKGDSAKRIAERFGLSEALVAGINPSATYQAGEVVRVVVDLPVVTTITTETSYTTTVQEATADGEKAALLTETIETDRVLGVPFRTRVVATETKELTENKPVASVIESVGSSGFCWPLDKAYRQYVSSYWGDGRGHRAVDIAANYGVPILSVLDGVVVSINSSGSGYGQHFVIDHGNGLKTLYAHCSKVYVTLGEQVSRGEVVGLVGSTGYSTGTHLHFEVMRNGARVNPCSYLGIS